MKMYKYITTVILVIIVIGFFSIPSLESHQKVVKNELKTILKNKFKVTLSQNNVISSRIDSLIQIDNYGIISFTKIIVNDKFTAIGVGCLGKVWINGKFDSVGEKLIVKLIRKPLFFSVVEISLDESVDSTVTIGNQVWMKKDFDKVVYNNGDTIPQIKDASEWVNLKTGAWCYLDNDSSNLKLKGRLYNWYALNDPRGIAPEGYRIPEAEDWKKLVYNLGDINNKLTSKDSRNKIQKYLAILSNKLSLNKFENIVGFKLKKPIGWTGLGNGSNESGFGAVQAGDRFEKGVFTHENAHWWSKTNLQNGTSTMFFVGLERRQIFLQDVNKSFGLSIRFIKK
jgi:uncharacterized protein (TIGR02145 family)